MSDQLKQVITSLSSPLDVLDHYLGQMRFRFPGLHRVSPLSVGQLDPANPVLIHLVNPGSTNASRERFPLKAQGQTFVVEKPIRVNHPNDQSRLLIDSGTFDPRTMAQTIHRNYARP